MKIIKAFPPNWSKLKRAFPITGRQGIIYAWGDTIYNPSGGVLPPWIVRHEEVHGERQRNYGCDGAACACNPVTEWWDRYVADARFRLSEEILAHRVEWQQYSGPYRDHYLGHMAERLSGSLYGNMLTFDEAVKEITK